MDKENKGERLGELLTQSSSLPLYPKRYYDPYGSDEASPAHYGFTSKIGSVPAKSALEPVQMVPAAASMS